MSEPVTAPPKGLRAAGKRLWTAVTSEFELGEPETLVLLQAARCADRLDTLDRAIRRGRVVDPTGAPHSALGESRQQSILLARLVAALRLPDAEDVRPQRRSSRGTYQWRQRPQLVSG
jgi:hypothetical protein